jgi:hypothetical protein
MSLSRPHPLPQTSTPRTLSGALTLVQERRIQIVDDAGVAHLLVLAHDIALDDEALRVAAGAGARVTVTCEPSAHLVALLATDLAYADGKENPS